jgi:hypothetical protein
MQRLPTRNISVYGKQFICKPPQLINNILIAAVQVEARDKHPDKKLSSQLPSRLKQFHTNQSQAVGPSTAGRINENAATTTGMLGTTLQNKSPSTPTTGQRE